MSQLTDFLMIGMVGVGGLFVFFNWAQVEGWLKGSGGCSGTSGNCSYNKCKDGRTKADWCWTSNGTRGHYKSCVTTDIDDPAIQDGIQVGCDSAKVNWCKLNSADGKCGGTTPPPVGGCKPVNTGNCTYDCKGHFCWRSTANTPTGPKSFQQCNTNSAGANSNISQSCATVRANFCALHSPDGKCGPGGCPAGKVLGPNGNCIAGNVSDCDAGAKAWIARNANAFLARMKAGGPGPPAQNDILAKWPSIVKSLSILNACSPIRLHINSAAWCKQFAQLLTAIMLTYKMTLTIEAKNSLGLQYNTGRWYLGPWLGASVLTFRGKLEMNPNTPYGRAYSTTLNGRENAYDPYGDQRYSFTLPKEGMKVKVSN